MKFKLEICVDSVDSAITAEAAGAHRVELCANLAEGGTTPGYGTIVTARANLSIALHVLIRPRSSDFLYNEKEMEIMTRDIEMCGKAGVDGVVIGLILPDGNIDIERTSKVIEFARPMKVTFHRAFDLCKDPVKGLEDIISTGADRVLTSGQMHTAIGGVDLLRNLVLQANDRIVIMPGSGIDDSNIEYIAKVTGAHEFHLSARKSIDSKMRFRRHGLRMGKTSDEDEYSMQVADGEKIANIIRILNMI
jgi:copper homeostasis protein